VFPADERGVTSPISPPVLRPLDGFGGRLALVDDRASEPTLGGNKARKLLGGLLREAQERGARRLFTFGAYGSHHVLATAVLGARAGFEVHAALWPQPETAHTREVRRAGLAAGLVAHRVQDASSVPAVLDAARVALRGGTHVIPLGGSTPSSLAAHARAAHDLVRAHPEVADLDAIVVPFGSGGTALGIAVGLADALGPRGPRVIGVAVSAPSYGSSALAADLLARAAVRGLVTPAVARLAWARLHAERSLVGAGYGASSPAVEAAIARGATLGLKLEATYTGKAFAAAFDRAARGDRVAFWMTLGRLP
jgi:1-aminocyclopropane-1-carboxylate deaminase/D-cysteine desulfhydrase-like pyridoxal-dependent ACC family enzyme